MRGAALRALRHAAAGHATSRGALGRAPRSNCRAVLVVVPSGIRPVCRGMFRIVGCASPLRAPVREQRMLGAHGARAACLHDGVHVAPFVCAVARHGTHCHGPVCHVPERVLRHRPARGAGTAARTCHRIVPRLATTAAVRKRVPPPRPFAPSASMRHPVTSSSINSGTCGSVATNEVTRLGRRRAARAVGTQAAHHTHTSPHRRYEAPHRPMRPQPRRRALHGSSGEARTGPRLCRHVVGRRARARKTSATENDSLRQLRRSRPVLH